MITLDGGTGDVIIGEVDLVPPQINEDFETLLGWADEILRLRVRANADTPEDATKAREFGAEGIGLSHRAHVHDGRAAARRARHDHGVERGNAARRRTAASAPAAGLRRDLRGDGGPARDDPLARPAAARVPATARPADSPEMARRIRALRETNPMLGTRGCRLGLLFPEIFEMQVRAIIRAAVAVEQRTGDAPLVEIMHPLVGFAEGSSASVS